VVQSFALIQGVEDIIDFPTGKKWSEGPLSPLFERYEPPPLDPSLPFAKRLEKLSALARSVFDDDISTAELCLSGVESLRKAYALSRSAYSGRHRTMMWGVGLGKERFDISNCRHPVAIIILAHCAALVKSCEGPSWLWSGWSENVVHMAEQELDQDWQPWLQWPLRCIRDALEVDAVWD